MVAAGILSEMDSCSSWETWARKSMLEQGSALQSWNEETKRKALTKPGSQTCHAGRPCQHSSCRGSMAGKAAEHSPASSLHSLSWGEDAEPHPAVQGCCQMTLEGWLSPHPPNPSPWGSQGPGSRVWPSWLMMLQGFGCPCKGFEVSAQRQNRNICRAR